MACWYLEVYISVIFFNILYLRLSCLNIKKIECVVSFKKPRPLGT